MASEDFPASLTGIEFPDLQSLESLGKSGNSNNKGSLQNTFTRSLDEKALDLVDIKDELPAAQVSIEFDDGGQSAGFAQNFMGIFVEVCAFSSTVVV